MKLKTTTNLSLDEQQELKEQLDNFHNSLVYLLLNEAFPTGSKTRQKVLKTLMSLDELIEQLDV